MAQGLSRQSTSGSRAREPRLPLEVMLLRRHCVTRAGLWLHTTTVTLPAARAVIAIPSCRSVLQLLEAKPNLSSVRQDLLPFLTQQQLKRPVGAPLDMAALAAAHGAVAALGGASVVGGPQGPARAGPLPGGAAASSHNDLHGGGLGVGDADADSE